jgi:hypothetical protein
VIGVAIKNIFTTRFKLKYFLQVMNLVDGGGGKPTWRKTLLERVLF